MAKKREKLEIIKDILAAIKDKRQIKPTRLLYASNVSPQMFKKYITDLLKKNLIEEEIVKKQKYFILTSKGFLFLEEYRTVVNFIKNFGI